MCFMNEFPGNKLNKLSFRSEGSFCAQRETNTRRHTKHMGIHSHIGLLVDNRSDHIGCFPAYAREGDQFIHGQGHFTLKIT